MAVNPGVWGIDIGQCALKAIRLELINGAVTATAFDFVEHPKILSQPDANPDELTREALEKFLSRNVTKGDQIAMSVPGQSGLARFVKLPPVEEKKIVDIVKFEAKQQIPFPLEEVVWDYQKISEGTVTDGFAMDTEIGLFAMKRDMINRFIGHFQAVKLEVHHVQMAPLSLANFVTYEMLRRGGPDGEAAPAQTVGKKKCVVALDVGTDGSSLIITDGARIIWQRPIPVGGNHFTRALTKELKLTFAKAEHLKRNAAKSPELANILKALRPVLQEFVGEVQRSLGYFTNTHRDAQVDYMVGLGSAFKLPGLQKYLADKLNIEVRKPEQFTRLAGPGVLDAPAFKENSLSFPVAYGLAIQGLGISRITTNLLPPEITFDRKIRAKKPYAVAAAAMLLLGTTVLAYGYSIPYSDVSDKRISDALEKGKGVVNQARSLDTKINEKKTEIEKTETEVKSIIAGHDERLNWIAVNQFVNRSLPMPSNDLPEIYWKTEPAKRAWAKYGERMSKGIDPFKAGVEEDFRNHLAMIDVEAVYARFTPDLKGVYDELAKKAKTEVGLTGRIFYGSSLKPEDWWEQKADDKTWPPAPPPPGTVEELRPKDGGWIFEVRGYTYFNPQNNLPDVNEFIVNTLLKKIIDGSRVKPDEKEKFAADPIRGKISHAILFNTYEDKSPSQDTFKVIGTSFIDPLVGGGGGNTAGGGMASLMGGGTGGNVSSSGWRPLSAASGGGGGASMPIMPGMPGGTGGAGGPPGGGGMVVQKKDIPGGLGTPIPGGGTPGTPAAASTTASKIKPKTRYEFVIVFVWKEPTPSDKLRPFKGKDAAETTTPKTGG